MILPSYVAFRHHFAVVGRTNSESLTYAAGPPATITRGSGSFVTDGHQAGMSCDIAGTASNDSRVLIDTVAALTITLDAGSSLSAEGPVTSSLTSAEYYTDGWEKWPIANVRAGGFSNTWAMAPRPITSFPVNLTVNNFQTDIAAGSAYTWYIRQRTDDSTLQWISASIANPLITGTIILSLTAKCTTDIGASNGVKLTQEQQLRILRNVWVFVKRNSDGAIQQTDLLQFSHGTVL